MRRPPRAPARSLTHLLAAGLVAAVALWATGSAVAKAPAADAATVLSPATDAGGPAYVPGQVLVRYRPGANGAARADAREDAGGRLARRLALSDAEVIRLDPGETVPQAVARLRARDDVLWAEPDWLAESTRVSNDAFRPQLWGLENTGQPYLTSTAGIGVGAADVDIDATDVWDLTTGNPAIVVGVVDGGVAWDHPDLAQNIWANPGETGAGREANGIDDDRNGFVDDVRGWDFQDNDNDPDDTNSLARTNANRAGHGTHVSGTIGARGDNGVGVAGVNWVTTIMPVRVIGNDGASFSKITDAFLYAARNGARIVNASISGRSTGVPQVMVDALAASPNTLFVVAAGNDGLTNEEAQTSFPCALPSPNLICVAATDSRDQLTSFSNFGATTVDLAAPGDDVVSTVAYRLVLSEGFETDPAGRWTLTPGSWGRSTLARQGAFSLSDSPNGNYLDNADVLAISPAFDLTGVRDCRLSYGLRLETEQNFDVLHVAVVGPGTAIELQSFTGNTGGDFQILENSLAAVEGRTGLQVVFRLTSDLNTTLNGAQIDDIQVACTPTPRGANDVDSYDGTSMASPHVAGVAALVLGAFPTLPTLALRDAIIAGVDPVPGLVGKVVTGGRLNALGAYRQGQVRVPPPPPPAVAVVLPPPPPVIAVRRDTVKPRITALVGLRTGTRWRVRLRLSETSRVSAVISRLLPRPRKAPLVRRLRAIRARTLATGLRTIALGTLAPGRYRIALTAVDGARNRRVVNLTLTVPQPRRARTR